MVISKVLYSNLIWTWTHQVSWGQDGQSHVLWFCGPIFNLCVRQRHWWNGFVEFSILNAPSWNIQVSSEWQWDMSMNGDLGSSGWGISGIKCGSFEFLGVFPEWKSFPPRSCGCWSCNCHRSMHWIILSWCTLRGKRSKESGWHWEPGLKVGFSSFLHKRQAKNSWALTSLSLLIGSFPNPWLGTAWHF